MVFVEVFVMVFVIVRMCVTPRACDLIVACRYVTNNLGYFLLTKI